jgi:hypothetical protein
MEATMLRTISMGAMTAVLAMGCIKFQGQERNPAFVEAKAPEPTVAVAPVACRSSSPSADGNAFTSQFRVLIKAQIHAQLVELDDEQLGVVCSTLGKDFGNVISLGGSSEKDWRASAAMSAVVQDVASRSHAKSVFIPLAAFSTNCSRDTARVKDAEGNTVATIDKGTTTCEEGTGAMMRGYLFSSEGQIYWKSWAVVRSTSSDAIDGGVGALLAGMPASFGSSGAEADDAKDAKDAKDESPKDPPSAKGAKGAKGRAAADDDGGPEAALATMDPKTPAVCKEYVKAMCEKAGAGAPASARGALCASYVNATRAMTAAPNAERTCKIMLKGIKPTG